VSHRQELPTLPEFGQDKELKDPAQTELKNTSITMIQYPLPVMKVMFPFQLPMHGIVHVPI
jgi:hypothetical protein